MNILEERAAKTDTVAQWERIVKLADNPNLTNADYGDCDLDRLTRRIGRTKPEAAIENVSCPVCGYYCLGNGGIGCIDKPGMVPGCEEANHETVCD